MSDLQDRIAREIEEAFADTDYPGDGNIAYDQSGRHLECSQVARDFRGKQWQDLTTDFLRNNADALFFFSAAAYAYFLPAFLRASVRDFRGADVVPGNAIFSLSGSLSHSSPEAFAQRIANLTIPQRKAVAQFLRYLESEHADAFPLRDPQIALEEFWSRYLD
jgi:hypothetical protein